MLPSRRATGTMPIVAAYQRPAITPRGTAALRLAEFRDVWAALAPADRQWFAEDLRDLFTDAVCPELPPAPSR